MAFNTTLINHTPICKAEVQHTSNEDKQHLNEMLTLHFIVMGKFWGSGVNEP